MTNTNKNNSKLYILWGLCIALPGAVDLLFKWIVSSVGSVNLGPIGLKLSTEPGIVLTWLGSLGPAVQSLYFFGLGFFLIAVLTVVCLIFLKRKYHAGPYLPLLIGGLLGSISDGFINGSIEHWLHLFGWHTHVSFLCILTGTIGMLLRFFKKSPQKNKRKQIFIMKDQYNFCLSVGLTYIIFTMSAGFFSYMFIAHILGAAWPAGSPTADTAQHLTVRALSLYLFLFIILSSFLSLVCSLFVVYLSNRIYGPVYAFTKYLKETLILKKDPGRDFRLRKDDHFKFLEELMKELKKSLKNKG